MKNKKTIIIVAVIVVILVIALIVGGIFILPNLLDKDEEDKKNKKLEWGDVYLEVLNDEEKLEDMDNQKLQLCDLNKDSIPELIIYGIKNAKEYIANIYKINEKNEVDTVKVSLDNDFDLKLLYNIEEDDYIWYAVSKKEKSTDVYDLNISTETYVPKLLENKKYDEDFYEVEDNYSKKVDFDKNASKDEKEKVFEQAKDTYVETEKMITEEVKENVENKKMMKNISKIDSSKPIVYSVAKYDATSSNWLGTFEYPAININSDDVKKVNAEIKERYGFKESDYKTQGYIIDIETEESGYFYNINKNILSLVVYDGGNDSVWAKAYNINLDTLKLMKADDLIKEKGLNKNDVISKAKEVANKKFEDAWANDKKQNPMLTNMFSSSNIKEWKSELEKNINSLSQTYLNEKGELCILGEVIHPGGQEHCWMTIIINVDKDYSVSELKLKIWEQKGNNTTNTPSPSTTPTPTTSSTPKTSTSAKPKTSTKPKASTTPKSSSTSSSSNSYLPVKTTMSNIQFTTKPTTTVEKGVYKRKDGVLTITNSKKGSFDFKIECSYMTSAGYPNLGELSGTAKETTNGNFAYVEKKSQGGNYDYNVLFYIADGGIQIQDEEKSGFSPYCGNNVLFGGLYIK